MRRIDPVFAAILLVALALRLYLAWTLPYIHDEINTAIPLADTISFSPETLNLPLRGENHGALPAYIVHVSRAVLGTSAPASRALHVLFGLVTIAVVYFTARQWWGVGAGRWAAALLAFNEFYLNVSARATAQVPHLFFTAGAIFAFSRFLALRRPNYLYLSGLLLGLAFYCKEHSALLLPVFFATLLLPQYREWLKKPQPYLACAIWLLVVSTDLMWNARTDESIVNYAGQEVSQATYSRHLQRVGGIGLSAYPAMFYGRSAVTAVHQAVLGRPLQDETPEYESLNPLIGVVLLGGVLLTTARHARSPGVALFLLAFWGIFAFFTFIEKGNPPGRLDPVSWIWVEVTLIPATVLAGARLAGSSGPWRVAGWGLATLALLYACLPALSGLGGEAGSLMRAAFLGIYHQLQVAAESMVAFGRDRPLRAMGLALIVGGAVGSVVGFALARAAERRRQR